jgi:hypothetical protein
VEHVGCERANVSVLKSEHCQCDAVAPHEFHFHRVAGCVDMHNSANVSGDQVMLGDVSQRSDVVSERTSRYQGTLYCAVLLKSAP